LTQAIISHAEERCNARLIQVAGYILIKGGRRYEVCKKTFLPYKTDAHLVERKGSGAKQTSGSRIPKKRFAIKPPSMFEIK
jgi:hypothetical protein